MSATDDSTEGRKHGQRQTADLRGATEARITVLKVSVKLMLQINYNKSDVIKIKCVKIKSVNKESVCV